LLKSKLSVSIQKKKTNPGRISGKINQKRKEHEEFESSFCDDPNAFFGIGCHFLQLQ
jgi:hypothetical protein